MESYVIQHTISLIPQTNFVFVLCQSSDIVKNATDNSGFESIVPTWLNVDSNRFSGEVLSEPTLSDVELIIDTRLIVEFYSR